MRARPERRAGQAPGAARGGFRAAHELRDRPGRFGPGRFETGRYSSLPHNHSYFLCRAGSPTRLQSRSSVVYILRSSLRAVSSF